ncbi:zinc-ribbon domain-containing protein [Thermodesulfobacteriota bacterium]
MKRRFKESHPNLFEEVHPSKNMDIDFSIIYENSGRKIWWKCKKNPKHIWQQSITNRTRKNYGCPYCAGIKTLPEDSFAALYPKLVSEIHPDKNNDFDPYRYRPKSSKIIWWKCKKGHEWQEQISRRVGSKNICRVCKRINNSLAGKYPKIAEEWHPTKNRDLRPDDVIISSRDPAWWRCKKDPSHEWEVSVSARVYYKSGCPICSNINKKKPMYPSLEEYSPILSEQWHPTKNGMLKPSDIKPNSSKKVWWRCSTNPEHEWQSIIRNRALKNAGCPFCTRTRVSPENSLLIRFPEIAGQWHPTKNGSSKPSDFSYGSSKKVWWQCQKIDSHEWQSTITARTSRNRVDCPICTRSIYAETNSLRAVHPDIAAQWHPYKNGPLSPDQVTRASGKKVWWQCPDNPEHEWEAIVRNRTVLGVGCPHCAKDKNIIRLSEHLYDLVHAEIDFYHIFLSNLRSLRNLSKQKIISNPHTIQSFYRMLFASVITILEAYLSDVFHKNIISNNKLTEKYILSNPEFNQKKYDLAEILDWNKNIKKRISDYLYQKVLWHNIPKIENMYKEVLGVEFPDDISNIHRAVLIRHDIVHRNGRKMSGGYHKLDEKILLQLMEDVADLVEKIYKQLSK